MATLSQDRKKAIAKELTVASTWVQGPRRLKLLALADEIVGKGMAEEDDAGDYADSQSEMDAWQDQDPTKD